jgi:two-component system response regulator
MPNAILLVEDTPTDAKLILRALQRPALAANVVVARDGVEAVEWLLAAQTLPCIVFLDVKLPRLDGFEVLRRIRSEARTIHLPVVMLTSSNEDGDVLRAYAAGANSYVRKPLDAAELTETVQLLARYWIEINRPPPLP